MGKSQIQKKKLLKERRHNPLSSKGRVPDSHLGSGQAAASNAVGQQKEQAMLPILKKLQSADASERAWSCAAVANMIQNDSATRRLLQGKNVVASLIERLTDNVDEVVVESSGALRNLAIDGGHEICGEMYNKQIMLPLQALVPKISNTIQGIMQKERPADQASVISSKLVWALAENVISLFWCLSETSNKVLLAVNAANLVPFLSAFIVYRSQIPIEVVAAAAQCLYALSFDNKPFKRSLTGMSEAMEALRDVLALPDAGVPSPAEKDQKGKKKADGSRSVDGESYTDRVVGLKVLVAGTLRNVLEEASWQELDSQYILPLVKPLLSTDLQSVAAQASELAPQLPDAVTQAINAGKMQSDHQTPAELKMQAIERRLTTLMVALEVLTGVCAGLSDLGLGDANDDDDWINGAGNPDGERRRKKPVEENGDDEDDEMDEDEADMEDEDLIAQGRNPEEQALEAGANAHTPKASQSTASLLSMNLHLHLLALASCTPLSYPPIAPDNPTVVLPSPHPPTTSLLSAVHLRSLEALNNLLLSIAASAPTPVAPLPAPLHDPAQAAWSAWAESLGMSAVGPINEIWTRTFEQLSAAVPDGRVIGVRGQEIRADVLDMLLGVLMSLAKIAAGCGFLNVQDAHIASLIAAFPITSSPQARSRILMTLASLAMHPTVIIEQNRVIGSFLLETVSLVADKGAAAPALEVEASVAALDALFDVYGEERSTYDAAVFQAGGFLQTLSGLVGKYRVVCRGVDKRKDAELRERAEQAYENLVAFIKYRRSVA